MDQIYFEYRGRQYSGQLVSSTNIEPHYHWVYFNDAEITSSLEDDCIGFKRKGNSLQPTKTFSRHTDLIETVQKLIESRIS